MTITQETRREGLEHIEPKSGDIARKVYSFLLSVGQCSPPLSNEHCGATANEIHKATGISLNNVRSRLTELQNQNLVEAFDKKVSPTTGIRVAIWRTTKSGELPFRS